MTLPQTPPFRYVDRLLERDPGRSCLAIKRFSAGEENDATREIPFSLVVEALCQAAAFVPAEEEGSGRIVKIENAQYLAPVRAGDTLEIRSTVVEATPAALRAESVGAVEGRTVASLSVLVGRGFERKGGEGT